MKHTFVKHALWTALFVAGGAFAQDAAISGADFTSGKANAELSAIGSKAAGNGQTVVVTAPTYWQGKVAARIRAGAHGKPVTIRFSNGFYENVLVRTEAAAPAAKPEAKPEPKVAAQAAAAAKAKAMRVQPGREAKPEPKPAAEAASPSRTAVAAAPALNPAQPVHAPTPAPTPAPMRAPAQMPPSSPPQAGSNVVAVPQTSHQPVAVPIPTAAANPAGTKPAAPETTVHDDAAVRQRLLATLNDGHPAQGSLGEAQLQSGDQVYQNGNTLAVVRLDGLRRSLYWLKGPVDLQRVQYKPQGDGRYEVAGTIDPKAPVVHRAAANARHVVQSNIPAPGSAARAQLEQRYNNGQAISGTLTAARLQPEDRLLVDGGAIIVARREGNSMARYWLEGSIDLSQSGLQKVDANVYRVVGNALH